MNLSWIIVNYISESRSLGWNLASCYVVGERKSLTYHWHGFALLASNRMYARRHLAQIGRTGSQGSAGCAGRQAGRQVQRQQAQRQQAAAA